MKKHMLRLTLLAFVTLSAFSSCKKDKDDDKLAVNAENLIGNYKLADIKMKAAGQEVSGMDGVEDCAKDDVLQLKAGNVLQVVDEGDKCGTDETSEWSLNGNKVTIAATMLIFEGPYEIISLTKNQLVLKFEMSELGTSVTYTVYLNRQ